MNIVRSMLQKVGHQDWERTIVRIVAIIVGAGMLAFGLWVAGTIVLLISIFGERMARSTHHIAHYMLKIMVQGDLDKDRSNRTKTNEHSDETPENLIRDPRK